MNSRAVRYLMWSSFGWPAKVLALKRETRILERRAAFLEQQLAQVKAAYSRLHSN